MLKDIRLDHVTLADMEMLRRAAIAQKPIHDKPSDNKSYHVLFSFKKNRTRGDA